MIKIDKVSLLKNTPDYEDISTNIVKLSQKEMEELGMVKTCGCSSGGGCCRNKK